jgi:hypothetical protein
MADKGSGSQPRADTDAINTRLVELLEQVVANQAVQAVANMDDQRAELIEAEMRQRQGDRPGYGGPAAGLAYSQLQLGLFFRSVRNGLGNLGRNGERDAALIPAPRLSGDGTLTFVAPLPLTAERLNLVAGDGTVFATATDVGGEQPEISNAGAVAWVQIDDKFGNPILLGVPVRDPGGES